MAAVAIAALGFFVTSPDDPLDPIAFPALRGTGIFLLLICAGTVALIRFLSARIRRKQGLSNDVHPFSAVVVLWQLACVGATLLVALSALLSLFLGGWLADQSVRALVVVLVNSVLSWIGLGLVRDLLWLVAPKSNTKHES